jgi:hypothetical protein
MRLLAGPERPRQALQAAREPRSALRASGASYRLPASSDRKCAARASRPKNLEPAFTALRARAADGIVEDQRGLESHPIPLPRRSDPVGSCL